MEFGYSARFKHAHAAIYLKCAKHQPAPPRPRQISSSNTMSTAKTDDSACPVDHKTRDAWLSQARAATDKTQTAECPVDHGKASKSWSQTISSYLWSSDPKPSGDKNQALETNRVVSTIPRSASDDACPVEHGASANAEIESGRDSSGNWVYPSEKMFFDAMKRKGYDARVADMKTVVPIHNAVNERAWAQIKDWEAPYLQKSQYVTRFSETAPR